MIACVVQSTHLLLWWQFPIGIDPERFIQALETDQVKFHIKELRRFFAGRKVPFFLYLITSLNKVGTW